VKNRRKGWLRLNPRESSNSGIQYVLTFFLFSRQKMPVINIEDLTEKDKLKMEVDQLKKEVTLERMLVS
jgi:hypothetical protein